MPTLRSGCNAPEQGQQRGRLKSKYSHYLKWARFVGGGPCSPSINPPWCWLFYVTEECHTHDWPPSLSVRGILMYQGCGGTVRFPSRWHGDYEDSRPACVMQQHQSGCLLSSLTSSSMWYQVIFNTSTACINTSDNFSPPKYWVIFLFLVTHQIKT